ncbi:MAG: YigZ family protein [Gammaproteobacteria bacterium]|jgi:uncharacterized YigZ family protein|nr:YigZ family protein [Gammaproteobacteria bacterium]
MTYPIPDLHDQDLETRITVKQSLFIANLRHAPGRDACNQHLHAMRALYPDANHHCWAVVAAAPDNSTYWGFSDAGEPSGTAGRPMLQVLSHANIGEVSVVVIRYFGGTKLGTGGLVRAYGDAIKAVLADCPTIVKLEQYELGIDLPYDLSGKIEHLCQSHGGEVIDRQYGQQLQLRIKLPQANKAALYQALKGWPQVDIKMVNQ